MNGPRIVIPLRKLEVSQIDEAFSDFPMYDSVRIDPLSNLYEQSKLILDENVNYSSMLEEFSRNEGQYQHRTSKVLSKYEESPEGKMTESMYFTSPERQHDPVVKSPFVHNRHSDRAAFVATKFNSRGVNEVKTEQVHSPGKFLSPAVTGLTIDAFKMEKPNSRTFIENAISKDQLRGSTNLSEEKLPTKHRPSKSDYSPPKDSPKLASDSKQLIQEQRSPSIKRASISVDIVLDKNEILKLKDPFFSINAAMMKYVVNEFASQEKGFKGLLQLEREQQTKPWVSKYYLVFSYNSKIDEDEAQSLIKEFQDELKYRKKDVSTSLERLKFYLIYGNSTGWLVIKQKIELDCENKKISVKSTKYNPSNLFFDAKFREFDARLRKNILDTLTGGSDKFHMEQLPETNQTSREKRTKFVTSWDSGLAVLNEVFRKLMNISQQEINRSYLLYFLLEKQIRSERNSARNEFITDFDAF